MNEICSCGTQLVPDALFCHKCGKAQRDIAAVEPEPVTPPAQFVPPETPHPARVAPPSFRNPVALKIALMLAFGATVLMFLPLLNWLAAGFFAAFFYRRKTGSFLAVGDGVRLGWMTGVLTFPMAAVEQTMVMMSGRLGNVEEQMKSLPGQDPQMVHQMAQFFQTGPGLVLMLSILFVFVTLLTIAGAAIGAKLVGRE
ncbi:MAG TPA: zinc ribbon domain-containing protein [Candidatus Limnocylindrales bacterium]|nr:zinc ribbon domain-containing protein [Candidatus Limnocylindrales bacterium]